MAIGYGFCDTGSEVLATIYIFVKFFMPILVLFFANWVLNESKIYLGNVVHSKGGNAKGV